MKKILHYLLFAALLCGQFSVYSQQIFKTILSGTNETPPALSTGSGEITGTLTGSTLTISGTFAGLTTDYSASHIHNGIAGTAGPVLFTLTPILDPDNEGGTYQAASNTFVLSAAELSLLNESKLYINIHSAKYPAGELRAQLIPEADAYYSANLFGSHEVPLVYTAAMGNISAELTGNILTVSGSFAGLESDFNGGAHIHSGLAGMNGAILKSLTVVADGDNKGGDLLPASNTFTLSAAELALLAGRGLYINIHTVNNPGGEIRGQILPVSEAVFNAVLEGEAENPAVQTGGSGRVVVELKNNTIVLSGTFQDLESNFNGGVHIHSGKAGISGAIVIPLDANANPDNISGELIASENSYAITDPQILTMLERGFYINIHTVQVPSGEIRGQVLPLANAYFLARLHGYNEVEPVALANNGAVVAEWLQDSLFLSGTFSNLISKYNASVGSHIHEGEAGVNGPVIFALDPTIIAADSLSGSYAVDSNSFFLTTPQKMMLRNQFYYTNIHTKDNPTGEVRGQVMTKLNFFPGESAIVSPANSASATLDGSATDPFTIDYTDVTDPESDKIFYVWQLAGDMNFSNILLTTNTGTTSEFTTTIGALDDILAAEGVPGGGSATVYHRVITSDGSLFNFSDTFAITLTRGVVIQSVLTRLVSKAKIYPNPVSSSLHIEFTENMKAEGSFQLVNLIGEIVLKSETNGKSDFELQLIDLPSGIYFLNLISEGKLIYSDKIIKE